MKASTRAAGVLLVIALLSLVLWPGRGPGRDGGAPRGPEHARPDAPPAAAPGDPRSAGKAPAQAAGESTATTTGPAPGSTSGGSPSKEAAGAAGAAGAGADAPPAAAEPLPPATGDESGHLAEVRTALERDPARALQLAEQGHARFGTTVLHEEREHLAIRALGKLDRRGEARRRVELFQERYPQSRWWKAIEGLAPRPEE